MPDVLPKPCPFCGGNGQMRVEEVPLGPASALTYRVRCLICHARGPEYATEWGATEAWNARGESDE